MTVPFPILILPSVHQSLPPPLSRVTSLLPEALVSVLDARDPLSSTRLDPLAAGASTSKGTMSSGFPSFPAIASQAMLCLLALLRPLCPHTRPPSPSLNRPHSCSSQPTGL